MNLKFESFETSPSNLQHCVLTCDFFSVKMQHSVLNFHHLTFFFKIEIMYLSVILLKKTESELKTFKLIWINHRRTQNAAWQKRVFEKRTLLLKIDAMITNLLVVAIYFLSSKWILLVHTFYFDGKKMWPKHFLPPDIFRPVTFLAWKTFSAPRHFFDIASSS